MAGRCESVRSLSQQIMRSTNEIKTLPETLFCFDKRPPTLNGDNTDIYGHVKNKLIIAVLPLYLKFVYFYGGFL